MCGICGFYDHQPRTILDTLDMIEKLQHRGPDSVGVYLDGGLWSGDSIGELIGITKRGRISLGQARLEIVGGSEGVQPIRGESFTIVHNGEIYNHNELKEMLKHRQLGSGSDSEVIVHLIEEFYEGDLAGAVKKMMPFLDGMYAFAVTDGKSLVLARDPIGKKPIYFTNGSCFRFASERKALANGDKDIKRLAPGKILEVSAEGLREHTGYEIEKPPIEIVDMEEALDAYEQAFDRAIEKRIAGVRRAGCLFSGGIDSVLISHAIQQKGGPRITCYSVGCEGSSDIEMAKMIAEELDLDLRVEYLTEGVIRQYIPEIIEAIELNGLLQVEVAIPMYIAAKMCSEDGHKIMFTGQAADELFGGYEWYNDVVKEHGHMALHDKLWDDIGKLYLDTLEREDRMTMAHALELRAPFLDREVIRTAMRISPRLKVRDGGDPHRKLVHRELALRKGIPREIAFREKSPAQDGSGIHTLIESVASKHFEGRDFKEVELLDFGSSYRYLGDEYGTPEMAAFLQEITKMSKVEFLAGVNE